MFGRKSSAFHWQHQQLVFKEFPFSMILLNWKGCSAMPFFSVSFLSLQLFFLSWYLSFFVFQGISHPLSFVFIRQ